MDKLKLTGQNLGWIFNARLSCACTGLAIVHITKQPNLKLKTWTKQHLGSLPLAFALPAPWYYPANPAPDFLGRWHWQSSKRRLRRKFCWPTTEGIVQNLDQNSQIGSFKNVIHFLFKIGLIFAQNSLFY
jgi:hypothetical protein